MATRMKTFRRKKVISKINSTKARRMMKKAIHRDNVNYLVSIKTEKPLIRQLLNARADGRPISLADWSTAAERKVSTLGRTRLSCAYILRTRCRLLTESVSSPFSQDRRNYLTKLGLFCVCE